MPDTPETAKFLTVAEREFVSRRIMADTGGNNDRMQWKYIRSAFAEWRVYAAVILFLGTSIGVYGFTVTVPTVVLHLGYTAAQAQLMTVPVSNSLVGVP